MDLNWLHITDFHAGQTGQKRLWPQARELFFKQLPRLHAESGPWDLILFTGDLAFSGQKGQYAASEEQLLAPLTEAIAQRQDDPPVLLAVPGNHDLNRNVRGEGKLHHKDWIDPERHALRQDFWTSKTNSIRKCVISAFKQYDAWWKRQPAWSDPRLRITEGLLPGDFSATFTKDGVPFGILGLNSAFLQLTGDDYAGKLGLGLEQFHAACNGDGPAWARQHCACLLMTHHPWEWLEPDSQRELIQEIMGGNRFALHLCGHMHETRTREHRTGGGNPRRLMQARALFGLERFGDAKLERMHGCVAARLTVAGDPPSGQWRSWPRKYHLVGDDWDLVPDPDLRMDDTRSRTPPQPFDPGPGCGGLRSTRFPQPGCTGTADPDPSAPTLARAIDEVLDDSTGAALRQALAADPALASATPGAALCAADPISAILAFRRAIGRVRRQAAPGDWGAETETIALRIIGLLLGRCINADAALPAQGAKVQIRVRSHASAEVLWLHATGNGEQVRFVVLANPVVGEQVPAAGGGDQLRGGHDVLLMAPSEAGHGRRPYIDQLKTHLWDKVIRFAPLDGPFDDNRTRRLTEAIQDQSQVEPIYATLRPQDDKDPLNDPGIRRFLAEDIGLAIFDVVAELPDDEAGRFDIDEVRMRDQIAAVLAQIRGQR